MFYLFPVVYRDFLCPFFKEIKQTVSADVADVSL